MTGETPDNTAQSHSGPPSETSALAPLTFDSEAFREDIAEMELTDEQARELLQTLWNIMCVFVDIGWGVDAVQLMFPDLYKNVACDSNALLDSDKDEKGKDHA